LSRSGDIRDQILKWSKIDRNFACFWPPNFIAGEPPEFLEWDYKTTPDSDHVAKFQGDRSRDLGERVAKKKITSRVKHKPVRNYRSGRPNNKLALQNRTDYRKSCTVLARYLRTEQGQIRVTYGDKIVESSTAPPTGAADPNARGPGTIALKV